MHPANLHPIAELMLLVGLRESRLPEVSTLKPGKTFADLIEAWKGKGNAQCAQREIVQGSFEALLAAKALQLFNADVIAVSHVPDDGF